MPKTLVDLSIKLIGDDNLFLSHSEVRKFGCRMHHSLVLVFLSTIHKFLNDVSITALRDNVYPPGLVSASSVSLSLILLQI